MDARRQLRVGCEFRYTAAVDTPAVFQVVPLDIGPAVVRSAAWATEPRRAPARLHRPLRQPLRSG